MLNLEETTRLVCQIAREAGSYIRTEREGFSQDRVERKHAHDYVSYVDKGSEQLIVSRLRAILPEAAFITEEGTAVQTENGELRTERYDMSESDTSQGVIEGGTCQFTWVVDPLDGTTNFIHGFAPYAVSIALCCGHEIVVGVVYEVVSDACYYAWKGGKAWMNGRPLHVSTNAIDDALLCMQLPYNSDAYKPVITHLLNHFYGRVGSIRMIGSAAIALCYVADGCLDAYAERYIGQWDYMAGALIVKEAGGRVSNYTGSADFTEGDSVVASNGIVHSELLSAIASV